MQEWEYRVLTRSRSTGWSGVGEWDVDIIGMLPELGRKGWELVAVSAQAGVSGNAFAGVTSEETWIFKRAA